jgi:hypothetical protein
MSCWCDLDPRTSEDDARITTGCRRALKSGYDRGRVVTHADNR